VTVTHYHRPASQAEALGLLAEHGPDLLVMGGGTIVMAMVNEGAPVPPRVMSLRAAGLDDIETRDGILRIGAAAALSRVLAADPPAPLPDAIRATGSWVLRNRATIGGNLFTPSPGGDVTVALLALDATVRIAGPAGTRTLPLAGFHTGFLTTALQPGELVVGIDVPTAPREAAFVKFGRRAANTPSVVTVAVTLERQDGLVRGARIALGAAGPHPLRARAAEAAIEATRLTPDDIASAAAAAEAGSDPATDAIASAWYRRRMTRLWVGRALERIAMSGGNA
jgi:CO/xanthine dehydrogenase FAD-binding subunit